MLARMMSDPVRPNFIPEHAEIDDANEPFGIDAIAQRLAKMVTAAMPPLTISLSGEWGVGKTTLVARVIEKLPRDFAHAAIDLWTSDPRELRQALAIEIGAAEAATRGEDRDSVRAAKAAILDGEIRTGDTTEKPPELSFPGLSSWWDAVKANKTHAFVALLIVLVLAEVAYMLGKDNPVGAILVSAVVSIIAVVLVNSGALVTVRTTSRSVAPAKEEVLFTAELRKALRGAGESPKTVLVVVDNLDRLQATEAMVALGDIRFFVDDPTSRCLFLVPVDRRAFELSVSGSVGGIPGARDYLDKFFNVDLLLTKPAALDMRNWAKGLIASAFPAADPGDLSDASVIAATVANGTPRSVKRIVNGMVARSLSLDDIVRAELTLAKLAIVEALIARFPNVVRAVIREPRVLTTAREALSDANTPETRMNAVAGLFDRGTNGVLLSEGDELTRLVEFLISIEPFALSSDEVQTILSLREDRRWRGITNASEIKAALAGGDGAALAAALDGHGQTHDVCERAIVQMNDDAKSGFRLSVINAINALSPIVGGTPSISWFRRSSLDALIVAPSDLMRGLSLPAVEILFDPNQAGARGKLLISRAIAELETTLAGESIGTLIAILQRGSTRMESDELDRARKALAVRSPDELTPLFTPSVDTLLVRGPIGDGLVNALTAWSGGLDDEIAFAADRLHAIRRAGIEEGSIDAVAANLQTQLSALTASFVRQIGSLVDLLADAPQSPAIDALSGVLAAWIPDPIGGLVFAARLPVSKEAGDRIALAANSVLESSDEASTRRLLGQARSRLSDFGATVASILASRWIADGEEWELRIATDDGSANSWNAIATELDSASSAVWFARMPLALSGLPTNKSGPVVATRLMALVCRQISVLRGPNLPDVGAFVVRLVLAGADPAPAVVVIESSIGSATAGELAAWTEIVRAIVDGGGAPQEALVPPLWRQIMSTIDLPLIQAPWLASHGVPALELREAVLSAIASPKQSAGEIGSLLQPLRGKLRGAYQVRLALVAKAASATNAEDARSLLVTAKAWKAVPEARRAEFDALVAEVNPSFELADEIASLRTK
jgi:hypothetical protein